MSHPSHLVMLEGSLNFPPPPSMISSDSIWIIRLEPHGYISLIHFINLEYISSLLGAGNFTPEAVNVA